MISSGLGRQVKREFIQETPAMEVEGYFLCKLLTSQDIPVSMKLAGMK